ncbi:MAG: hypothetical protein RQ751_06945 [Longimicrobiales bacterium]|nr:hypothetical protein [Longimicrobiales bacterium]
MRRPHAVRRRTPVLIGAALAAALHAGPSAAQSGPAYRFGLSIGGVSTLGVVLERVYDWGSFELMLGTWSFRDLSISAVHKQYPFGGQFEGIVGLGLWTVIAFPPDENVGLALVARAPIGIQWRVADEQFANLEVGINRALAVRRTDPEDDTPLNRRLVPLPGVAYRWLTR